MSIEYTFIIECNFCASLPLFKQDHFFLIENFIGFFHEHTRSDRDQYITINWENVPDEFKHNFRPCTTYHEGCHDSGVGYDYDSIMHYGKRITGFIDRMQILTMKTMTYLFSETFFAVRQYVQIFNRYKGRSNYPQGFGG